MYESNDEWLNLTANKSPGCAPWSGVIVHETASPNPDSPEGTLSYNLDPKINSSYHDLIGRDGVRYRYLDPDQYIAWHAGVNTLIVVDGETLEGGEVNSMMIGIELDGANDGTPATEAQLATMTEVLLEYSAAYGFPCDAGHLITHDAATNPVDPTYKSDPKCTTIAELVARCAAGEITMDADGRLYRVLYDRSVVRSGPGTEYEIVGYVAAGREFVANGIVFGEVIAGDDQWIHAASNIGYITNTAVERIA